MHALRNVERMLAPGGRLLESHPLPGATVVDAARRGLGRLDDRDFARELRAMEASVAAAVDEGLVTPLAERRYEVAMRFDTGSELLQEVVTWRGATISVRLQRAVKRGQEPFAVELPAVLRVYATGSAGSPRRTLPGSSTSP